MPTIYFDMDGTLADLYNVRDWLPMLQAEDTTPYRIAKPTYDVSVLLDCMRQLIRKGYKIGVITWLAKNGTKCYNDATRSAKLRWIRKYFGDVVSEFHSCKYGTPKRNFSKDSCDILVDDNEQVRKEWNGVTIDASENEKMVQDLFRLAA